jgi:hypothetical protein
VDLTGIASNEPTGARHRDTASSERERFIWPALKIMPLLGDFAKRVRKATVSLFVPVRPPAWNNSPPSKGFFVNGTGDFP